MCIVQWLGKKAFRERVLFGGQVAAAPGFAFMLALKGDGNPPDDIIRIAGKVMR